ncbi:MAG: helix-hairpin-helix domain-containing protein [Bacteroidales bacterium]|jgi:competence ComEA-like helix-hairpin-helix protein|nr:helix-hairpin-helix domain-containing protein [Bacteroidales bacterium]
MSWKNNLRQYFSFSHSERYGIMVLCGLILLAFVVKLCLPEWLTEQKIDDKGYDEALTLFRPSGEPDFNTAEVTSTGEPVNGRAYFYFDPNHTSDQEWQKLGLNERQIRNIRNYQAKGGTFRKKEDLKKLYTVPVTLYESVAPYIRFATEQARTASVKQAIEPRSDVRHSETATPVVIELNSADSALLTQLRGVGPVFASRIVKYRNRVGGFANVEQLNEVYGIDSALVAQLTPQLMADSGLIRKIPVNKAVFKDLVSHPYLNEQQARGILYYRKIQTGIKSVDELVKNNILTQKDAQKIAPYLSFE